VIIRFEKLLKEDLPVKHLFSRLGLTLLLACGMIAICTSAAQAQDAAATYKSKCAMCHGADGKGSAMGLKMGAHDFTSDDVQKQTDIQLTLTITKGKAKMPAYDGKLKDTEIKDLVAYVRAFAKK
jgi:cytochrome c6